MGFASTVHALLDFPGLVGLLPDADAHRALDLAITGAPNGRPTFDWSLGRCMQPERARIVELLLERVHGMQPEDALPPPYVASRAQ